MSKVSFLQAVAVALSTIGMLVPNGSLLAAGPTRVQVKAVDAKIFDIALSQGGTFKGRVVDHTGTVVEGAEISIKQGSKQVAQTVTDKAGSFAVSNLKSGIYSVSSGATEGVYRVWPEKSAPPSAKEQSLVVLGENGARGNIGAGDGALWLVAAVATAGLVVGVIALTRDNNSSSSNSNTSNSLLPVSP